MHSAACVRFCTKFTKKLCFVQKSTSKDSLIVEISVIAYVLFPYAKTMVVLQRNRQEEAVGNSKYY